MADIFEKIADKLSSYQLFNYFFPGILFINAVEYLTSISFRNDDIVLRLFIYYTAGLVISRIGSLVIEFLYKGFCWVVYSDYGKYLDAERNDAKIEILSAENNTYRTLLSASVILLIVYGLDQFSWFQVFNESRWSTFVYIILLILLFSKSYNKQTSFVRMRVHGYFKIDDKEEFEKLKEKQKKRFKSSLNPFSKK